LIDFKFAGQAVQPATIIEGSRLQQFNLLPVYNISFCELLANAVAMPGLI
jgi:hypothetical protein